LELSQQEKSLRWHGSQLPQPMIEMVKQQLWHIQLESAIHSSHC